MQASVPERTDMATGILLTLLIGVLWSFVGVYYKFIARWNLSVFNISLVANVFSIVVLAALQLRGLAGKPVALEPPPLLYALFIIVAGALNSGGSLMLQRSMLYGRSGITWAIGQSAMIVPFVALALFFGERWIPVKVAGTVLVLAGMGILGAGRNDGEAPRPGYGLLLALEAFLVLGVAQSMTASTSYLSYRDELELRPVLLAIGGLIGALAGKVLLRDRGFRMERRALAVVILMSLQGLLVLLVQFKALDLLGAHGLGGIFFPVAIGTCIAGYSVWSIVLFKEKATLPVIAGTAVILVGILMYCLVGGL